jgi:pyruvate formate lyase activating enzyme
MDTAPLLKEKDIKTILVTNGYSTPLASKELIDIGIDAANIDIKAMSDSFYKSICGVKSVKPVLDTAKRFKDGGIHVEITNLIIPDHNDNSEELESLAIWVKNNLGKNTPLHFSAYHPDFQMPSDKRTPYETLDNAYTIATNVGLDYVYVGNIQHPKGGNTYCPKCKNIVIGRSGYRFSKINITEDKTCKNCGYDLSKDILGDITKNSNHRFMYFS